MELLDYATKCKYTTMEKIYNLQTKLLTNLIDIEAITDTIANTKSEDVESLEELYKKEFMLYMDNSHIQEDLEKYIEAEPVTEDNRFELAKIKRDIKKMSRVGIFTV